MIASDSDDDDQLQQPVYNPPPRTPGTITEPISRRITADYDKDTVNSRTMINTFDN
jgi:hypothetical protein